MSTLSDVERLALFAVGYVLAAAANWLTNYFEFKRCPEKQERYDALPFHYKLGCWLVVLPLFAGTLVKPLLGFVGLVAFVLLEAACIRWYRKAGLW